MSIEKQIVDYKDKVEDIEHWVTLKGEFRYEAIIAFLKEKGIERTWKNVTNYIKYDKRSLINSFKYLVVLEEMYKSFVYRDKPNNKVINYPFSKAYHEFLSLGEAARYDGIDLEIMKAKGKTLNVFRNRVVHNNILIKQKFDGLSLEEVLRLFVEVLPKSYRDGFIKDINDCSNSLLQMQSKKINES